MHATISGEQVRAAGCPPPPPPLLQPWRLTRWPTPAALMGCLPPPSLPPSLTAQGHAGTVPMRSRKDPLAAAAEVVAHLERLCNGGRWGETFRRALWGHGRVRGRGAGRRRESHRPALPHLLADPAPMSTLPHPPVRPPTRPPGSKEFAKDDSLVCTVGSITVWPNAGNVIPGAANFTLDIRSRWDAHRQSGAPLRPPPRLAAGRALPPVPPPQNPPIHPHPTRPPPQ